MLPLLENVEVHLILEVDILQNLLRLEAQEVVNVGLGQETHLHRLLIFLQTLDLRELSGCRDDELAPCSIELLFLIR